MKRLRQEVEDLTGKKYGLLTVIAQAKAKELGCEIRTAWQVRCECGEISDVVARYLKRGSTKTCGKLECKRILNARLEAPAT